MPRKRGGKTIFSSQEAAEIIFMNSESEGEDVDLGEDICGDSDFDTGSEYVIYPGDCFRVYHTKIDFYKV